MIKRLWHNYFVDSLAKLTILQIFLYLLLAPVLYFGSHSHGEANKICKIAVVVIGGLLMVDLVLWLLRLSSYDSVPKSIDKCKKGRINNDCCEKGDANRPIVSQTVHNAKEGKDKVKCTKDKVDKSHN